MSRDEDRRRSGAHGSAESAGTADHSRSKIPQFKPGFDGANTNPKNHVFQADRRDSHNGKIIALNRDGDIRRSDENFKQTIHKTPGYMNIMLSINQRKEALEQLMQRINYHTGLALQMEDFTPTEQARDRTRMGSNIQMDVAWKYDNGGKPVELRIPNKEPTKAPRPVNAVVSITLDAHDAHISSGPDCPHYGAKIRVSSPDKPDVSWAAAGVQSYEEKKAKLEKPSPSITDDLTMHVLVDAVPASQSTEEINTKKK